MANRKHIELPAGDNRARSLSLLAVFGGLVQTITNAAEVGIGEMTIYFLGRS